MTKEKSKTKPSLAKQAAVASVVAPGIAILANVMTSPATQGSRIGKLIIGIVAFSLVIAGLVCAIVGLCGVRKHGRKGILGRSIAGLLINGFIIALAVFTFQSAVRNKEHRTQPRYTIAIPPEFEKFPAGMQQPNMLHSYIKGDPTDKTPDILFFVETLGGTISKDDDLSDFAASHPDVTILKEDWKGHRIDVSRVQETLQGVQFLTFNAQVPVLPQAIQVRIAGLMEREDEMKQDLRTVLAGIDGPTNW